MEKQGSSINFTLRFPQKYVPLTAVLSMANDLSELLRAKGYDLNGVEMLISVDEVEVNRGKTAVEKQVSK